MRHKLITLLTVLSVLSVILSGLIVITMLYRQLGFAEPEFLALFTMIFFSLATLFVIVLRE